MSLKENIDAIKEELSTEEKFLESMIKGESFFKKNKKLIISALVAIFLGVVASAFYNYQKEQNLKDSNIIYKELLSKNTPDASLEEKLKSKNPALYELYKFQLIVKSNDPTKLNSLKQTIKDPILKDLLTYQTDSITKKDLLVYVGNDGILKNLASLQEAFINLENKNFQKAKDVLNFIPINSPLHQLANSFKHYHNGEK